MRRRTFEPFSKVPVSAAVKQIKESMEDDVASLSSIDLQSPEIADYFVEKYHVDVLSIDFDSLTVSPSVTKVPAKHLSHGLNTRLGRTYERQVLTFMIPVSGDMALLHWRGSTGTSSMLDFFIEDDHIAFDIIDDGRGKSNIESLKAMHLSPLKSVYEGMVKEVEQFNKGLGSIVSALIEGRLKVLAERNELIEQLGVPVYRRKDVPKQIDITRKPKLLNIQMPDAPGERGSLADSVYRDILEIIVYAGIATEQHKTLHEGKGEEGLRDNLLMALAPQFENAATGETFNRNGKTDILIRHKTDNVFVAECKIWHGRQALHEAIDQLTGYLTWRDTKTALIVFVRDRGMSSIVNRAEIAVKEHPRFLKENQETVSKTKSYQFALDDDGVDQFTMGLIMFQIPD